MASLTIDTGGNAAVYVTMPGGKRRPVRLGIVARKQAERIRHHICELEAGRARGIDAPADTRAWLSGLTGDLRDRLSRVGLCEAVKHRGATLGDFTATWEGMKEKVVKPQTLVRIRQGPATLIEYFGKDRKLATIT